MSPVPRMASCSSLFRKYPLGTLTLSGPSHLHSNAASLLVDCGRDLSWGEREAPRWVFQCSLPEHMGSWNPPRHATGGVFSVLFTFVSGGCSGSEKLDVLPGITEPTITCPLIVPSTNGALATQPTRTSGQREPPPCVSE